MSFVRSFIKTVQRGTITLAGVASNTATITAVDTSNAYVVLLGYTHSDTAGQAADHWVRIALTNSTTVTATRIGTAGTVVVSFEVVEFLPGRVRSIQPVSISLASVTTNTATLGTTLLSTAKAYIAWGGSTATPAALVPESSWCDLVLTNTTTVTANRNTNAGGAVVNGTVVEFK